DVDGALDGTQGVEGPGLASLRVLHLIAAFFCGQNRRPGEIVDVPDDVLDGDGLTAILEMGHLEPAPIGGDELDPVHVSVDANIGEGQSLKRFDVSHSHPPDAETSPSREPRRRQWIGLWRPQTEAQRQIQARRRRQKRRSVRPADARPGL
ncbi:hypothetical protein EBQ81_00670, partial [bacterium]|nr:hypothetical protein [bacterium]